MSASITRNIATQKVKGLFVDEEARQKSQEQLYADIGKQIAETLGEMKGAVMKVGQIASQVKDILPEEVSQALEVLQKASPPMPYTVIRKQFIKALGEPPETLFAEFSDTPFAAASIGQVHRARTHDGQDVVVKIQYPGVKESCDSDLRHLKRLLKLAGLVKVSKEAIDATFNEIRQTLHEELDYEHEAQNLLFFAEHYRNHPKVIVPGLVKELSAETILTLTYVAGDSLAEVKAPRYSQDTINQIGYLIFETFGRQIYDLHAVHSDPHPGNFAFRPDGTLIIFDFGAVKRIQPETTDKLRALIRDVLEGRIDTIDDHMRKIGARTQDAAPIPASYYKEWLDIVMVPFQDYQPFDFGRSTIHKRAAKKAQTDALKVIGQFQPVAETMYIDRVLTGHYWTLMDLGVQAAFRPLVEQIVLNKPNA
ncbi:Conserved hypothetical protein [gamma proteobacterium HdN1]|nr:Conserved hypothetical protein [gamma proteobacterium HdN1]